MKQDVSKPTNQAAAYDPFAWGGLAITRRVGEQIVIGKPPHLIVVTVVKVQSSNSVRFAVRAPEGVIIHRREVFDRIRAEELANQSRPSSEASSSVPSDQGDPNHDSHQAAQSTTHNPSSSSAA